MDRIEGTCLFVVTEMNPLEWFQQNFGGGSRPGFQPKTPRPAFEPKPADTFKGQSNADLNTRFPGRGGPKPEVSGPKITGPKIPGIVKQLPGLGTALSVGASIGQHMEQNTPINYGGSGRGAGRAAFSAEKPTGMADIRGNVGSGGPVAPADYTVGDITYSGRTGRAQNAPMSYSTEELAAQGYGGKTAAPAEGGGRKADPLPTTLDEAYNSFVNDYTGGGYDEAKIRSFLDGKKASRFNLGEQDAGELSFAEGSKVDLGEGYRKGATTDYSKMFAPGAKTEGDAFTLAPEGFESSVRNRGTGSMAALRERDYQDGLLYASGKYWSEGPDGKLQAIEAPQGSRTTLTRDQALEIAKSRRQAGPPTVAKPADTDKSTLTGGALPGGNPFTRTSGKEDPVTPGFTENMPETRVVEYEGALDLSQIQKNLGNIYERMNTEGAKLRALEDSDRFGQITLS